MKIKLLATVVVASVMATANPLHADWSEDVYGYVYVDDTGNAVGRARDRCTRDGINGIQWLSGYATANVRVDLVGVCVNGIFGPY